MERTVLILDHLCRGPVALSELSRESGLPKSTLHGLLQTLVKHNYVHQEPETGHYRLGYRVLALGDAFLEHCNLRETAAPYLRRDGNKEAWRRRAWSRRFSLAAGTASPGRAVWETVDLKSWAGTDIRCAKKDLPARYGEPAWG